MQVTLTKMIQLPIIFVYLHNTTQKINRNNILFYGFYQTELGSGHILPFGLKFLISFSINNHNETYYVLSLLVIVLGQEFRKIFTVKKLKHTHFTS